MTVETVSFGAKSGAHRAPLQSKRRHETFVADWKSRDAEILFDSIPVSPPTLSLNRVRSEMSAGKFADRGSATNSVRHEKRRGRFSLSPREERAGREVERWETDEKRPPPPRPSPPFLGRRGRRESLLRSKQTTCRTLLVCDPQRLSPGHAALEQAGDASGPAVLRLTEPRSGPTLLDRIP